MTFLRLLISAFFYIFTALSFAQDNFDIIHKAIKKYEKSSSISYNITYSIKTFDSSSPLIEYGSVQILKKPQDTIFGSQFIYTYHYEDTVKNEISPKVTKAYIDPYNLYVIEPDEQKTTRFNPSKGEIFTITGRFDGDLLNTYYLGINELKKEIRNNQNSVSYTDSLDFYKVNISFPDDDQFSNEKKIIYINKNSKLIEKIEYQVQLEDQTQRNVWSLSSIHLNNLTDVYFDQKIQQSLQKYEMEDYVSPEEDYYNLLSEEETAPHISGTIYPDYKQQVDLKPRKLTILDFWYTSCYPCIKTIPKLNKLKEKYGDEIEIIGVNNIEFKSEQKEKIEALKERFPISYKIFLTEEIPEAYNIKSYPTIYIIDSDGRVKYANTGYSENMYDKLVEIIDELIKN